MLGPKFSEHSYTEVLQSNSYSFIWVNMIKSTTKKNPKIMSFNSFPNSKFLVLPCYTSPKGILKWSVRLGMIVMHSH